MAIFNYDINTFISNPTDSDMNIKIYDKNRILRHTIVSDISFSYTKNNLLIIKISNDNDIILDFIDENSAISAQARFIEVKKLIEVNTSTTVDSFTKYELTETRVLDTIYYNITAATELFSPIDHTHIVNIDDINDVSLSSITNGEVLTYNNGTWVNSSFTFNVSEFLDFYITKEDLGLPNTVDIHWLNISNTPTAITEFGISDVYTKDEVFNKSELLGGSQENLLGGSLDNRYYTIDYINNHTYFKTDINNLLLSKSDTGHTHTLTSLSDIPNIQDGQFLIYSAGTWVATNTIDTTLFYTKTQIDALNLLKSDSGHTHQLSDISNSAHTHKFSEISETPTTLNGYSITDAYTKSETENVIENSPLNWDNITNTAHTHTEFFTKTELENGVLDLVYLNRNVMFQTLDNRYITIDWANNNIIGYINDNFLTSAQTFTILEDYQKKSDVVNIGPILDGYSLTSHTHTNLNLTDIADTNIQSPTDNEVLIFENGEWKNLPLQTVEISDFTYSKEEVNNIVKEFIPLIGSSGITGNLVPNGTGFTLGSVDMPWSELYVSNNTIYIGTTPVSVTNGSLSINGDAVITQSTSTAHTHDDRYFTKDELLDNSTINTIGGALDYRYVTLDWYNNHFTAYMDALDNNYYDIDQLETYLGLNYYDKTGTDSILLNYLGLSYSAHSHTISNLSDVVLLNLTDNQILVFENGKWVNKNLEVDLTNYYTKTQLDNGSLDTRYYTKNQIYSSAQTYSKSDVDGLFTGHTSEVNPHSTGFFDLTSTSHTHNDTYFTKIELLPENETQGNAVLDDRYYTKIWIDNHLSTTATIGDNYYNKNEVYTIHEVDELLDLHISLTGASNPHEISFNDLTTTAHTHDDRYFTENEILPTNIVLPFGQGDGSIDSRYYTKLWIDGHYYTISEVDDIVDNLVLGEGMTGVYYTKTQVNNLLSTKSNTGHSHISSDITDFDITGHTHSLNNLTNTAHTHSYTQITGFDFLGHNHDTLYFTKSQLTDDGVLDNVYATKAWADNYQIYITQNYYNSAQTNAILNSYYNSAQTNSLLSTKADTGHTHTLSNLTDTLITSPVSGNLLSHNGTKWVNIASPFGNYWTKFEFSVGALDYRYMTNTAVTSALSMKSDSGHSHNFYGLTSTAHTHLSTDITDFDITGHSHLMEEISNVILTDISSGQTLVYNNGNWINTDYIVPDIDLSNYYTSAQTNSQIEYVITTIDSLYKLNDVNSGVQFASNGDTLVWSALLNNWVASSATVNLDDYYNKTEIDSNFSVTSHTHTLNDLSDVDVTGASEGKLLIYSGGTWVAGGELIDPGTLGGGDYVARSGDTMTGDLGFYFMTGITNRNIYVDINGKLKNGSDIVSLYIDDIDLIDILQTELNWSGNTFINTSLSGFTIYQGQKYIDDLYTYEYFDGIMNRSFYSQKDHNHSDIYYTKTELFVDGVLDNRYLRSIANTYMSDLADVNINESNLTTNSILKYNTSTSNWELFEFNMTDYALKSEYTPNTRIINAGTLLTGGGSLNTNITLNHAAINTAAITVVPQNNIVTNIVTDGYGHVTSISSGNINDVVPTKLSSMQDVLIQNILDGQFIRYDATTELFFNVTLSKTMIPDLNDANYVQITTDQSIEGIKEFIDETIMSDITLNNNLLIGGMLSFSGDTVEITSLTNDMTITVSSNTLPTSHAVSEYIKATNTSAKNVVYVGYNDNTFKNGTINAPFDTITSALSSISNQIEIYLDLNGTDTVTSISDVNNSLIKEGMVFNFEGQQVTILKKYNQGFDNNSILLSHGVGVTTTLCKLFEKYLIIVSTGFYPITTSINKTGVSYYFENGSTVYMSGSTAIVSQNILEDDIVILGNGDFISETFIQTPVTNNGYSLLVNFNTIRCQDLFNSINSDIVTVIFNGNSIECDNMTTNISDVSINSEMIINTMNIVNSKIKNNNIIAVEEISLLTSVLTNLSEIKNSGNYNDDNINYITLSSYSKFNNFGLIEDNTLSNIAPIFNISSDSTLCLEGIIKKQNIEKHYLEYVNDSKLQIIELSTNGNIGDFQKIPNKMVKLGIISNLSDASITLDNLSGNIVSFTAISSSIEVMVTDLVSQINNSFTDIYAFSSDGTNIYISTKLSDFNETLLNNLNLLYTFEALSSVIFDSIGGRIIENPDLFNDVIINQIA